LIPPTTSGTAGELAILSTTIGWQVAPTSPPLETACLHLAASTPNFKIQEHFNDFVDSWVKQAASGPGYPEVKDGYFSLPEGPGLGVTLNEDFIREHPAQGETFNLFKEDWHRRQVMKPAVAVGR